MGMGVTEIYEWITNKFKPIPLFIPSESVNQCIEEAVTYFNNHSAVAASFDCPIANPADQMVVVPDNISWVVKVYPSRIADMTFGNHPDYMLLGFVSLNTYTQDLMLLQHTYGGYSVYLGANFRFKFLKSETATGGGKLFLQGIPQNTTRILAVGCKRFNLQDNITDEFSFDWIRKYSYQLVKLQQGEAYRKGGVIGINNDGGDTVAEALNAIKDMQEELRKSGRWMLMGVRR